MQELVPKLTDRDYVMCYWQVPGADTGGPGHFAWLVERGDQLYFFTVLGMIHFNVRHWAYKNDRFQVDVVRNTVAALGFRHEVPIFAPYRNAKEQLRPLLDDLKIYEENLKQVRKMSKEQHEAKIAEQEGNSDESSTTKKITDITDARKVSAGTNSDKASEEKEKV